MPFTFSHPAIILPLARLKKYRLSLTGMFIGSMAPDFEYFIKMKGDRAWGHSLAGVFLFDLPLTLLLAFLFHMVIRNPLLSNLPYFLQRKFSKEKEFDWIHYFKSNAGIVILSILIGVFSHLFLDAFTNENGFFVRHIPFLKEHIRTDYTSLYYNNILSYLLSFLGVFIIIVAILVQPADRSFKVSKPTLLYWLTILILAALIIYGRAASIENERMKKYWYLYISSYAILSVSAFMISMVVTSFIFTLMPGNKKNNLRAPQVITNKRLK